VSELSALATILADVTSQHESVALSDSSRHLAYLDRYGQLEDARDALASIVDELMAVRAELDELRSRERHRSEREAFLRFQRDAIDEVDPRPDEIDELSRERGRLKNAGRLGELTQRVATGLDDEGSLCDRLGRLTADLRGAAELDPELAPLAGELDDCWSRLRDAARDVGRYAEGVAADPARLEEIQERLYALEELMRQHGPTIDDLLAARARIAGELEELAGAEQAIPELDRRRGKLLDEASQAARKLSKRRQRAAKRLGDAISAELSHLGMGSAKVVVDVSPLGAAEDAPSVTLSSATAERSPRARLSRDGIDRAQFLIAPNRGLEPQPLARIASGGELSRALLALKRALGRHESNTTGQRATGVQVFDEVDADVGGETADRIGRAIAGIARHRQVLCITHLAAIAAHADAHFVVQKHDEGDVTETTIEAVNDENRIAEVARMLTGAKVTGPAKRAAEELLALASVVEAAAE
jgi:DNA repair protein RecN (Recombination protein N)